MEEQPRKLESVIQVAQMCLNIPNADATKDFYHEQAQDLVFNENVLLQTLGFDVAVDHPHTHVVRTCQLVKGRGMDRVTTIHKEVNCAMLQIHSFIKYSYAHFPILILQLVRI